MRGAAGHSRSRRARRSSKERRRADYRDPNIVRENITSQALSFTGRACGISDIVKRRLIRVWDLQSNLWNLNRNLQVISALVHRKMDEL
jgi:hypothetical protein